MGGAFTLPRSGAALTMSTYYMLRGPRPSSITSMASGPGQTKHLPGNTLTPAKQTGEVGRLLSGLFLWEMRRWKLSQKDIVASSMEDQVLKEQTNV